MIFLEDYTLLEEIGQGGFATVYKVRHNRLGYVRAIRVLNSTIAFGEDDPLYQKFLNECRLLLCLGNGNHPNIVHIYQPLLKENKAIVEMDYIDGQDIGGYLRSNSGFVDSADVIRLLTDMSSALAYCHEDIYKYCMDRELDDLQDDPDDGSKLLIDDATRKRLIEKYRVIHNDIHSGNIIRRENGSFVLLDFGLAIEGDEVIRSSRRKNGAPEFMAPEKWENDSILTPQTDIYSFGIVLYEYLTGRVPFPIDKTEANTDKAIFFVGEAHRGLIPDSIFEVRKETYEKLYPGSEYVKDYPDWLEDVIMKCLEKNPADRYSSAKELYVDVMEKIDMEKGCRVAPAVPVATQVIKEVVDNPELLAKVQELTDINNQLSEQVKTLKENVQQPAVVHKTNKPLIYVMVIMAVALGVLGYMWYSCKNDYDTVSEELKERRSELNEIKNGKAKALEQWNKNKR
jgi:serine/threonine protein kinase